MEKNPLEELYVDQDEMNQQRLAKVLKKYIGISKKDGEAVFKDDFERLDNQEKVLAYLLYRRAACSLGHIKESKIGARSEKIAEITGVTHSSVTVQLSNARYIKEDEELHGFYIPMYAIGRATEEVER